MSESIKVTITPGDNGPIRCIGPISIVDADGNLIRETEETYLCRCGQSSNKPFCDGSHRADFESIVRAP